VQPSSTQHFSCAQPYTTITRAMTWERQVRLRRRRNPWARALVELDLDAGPRPNDEQALHKMHALLVRRGLA
jgi:hypothetical protein